MGKFAKQNRECVAKGFVKMLLRSKEPVVIHDEAVLHIVSKQLGKIISIERTEKLPAINLFHKTSPAGVIRLVLNDRVRGIDPNGIDPNVLRQLKEDLRKVSDKSQKTIQNIPWPEDAKNWHYFRLCFKVQRIVG